MLNLDNKMVYKKERNVSILLAIPPYNVHNTGGIIVSFQEVIGCIQSKVYLARDTIVSLDLIFVVLEVAFEAVFYGGC